MIKHEERSGGLSARLDDYLRNNGYKRTLKKNEPRFRGEWGYSCRQLLMWTYRLYRQYEYYDFESLDELIARGVPRSDTEGCYLSYRDLPPEYIG